MDLQVAAIQFAPTVDKSRNLDEIHRLISEASQQGAELVVLPEYATFTNAVIDKSFIDSAEDLDGKTVASLKKISIEQDVSLIAGINEPDGNGRIYNTLVGIQEGEVKAIYRKVHLYDAFGVKESTWVTPGDITAPQLLMVKGFKVGMQTCYDLRFPEVSRTLVDAGADILALPAEWVPGALKEFHWMTLLRARAIENTVYVVAADQSAPTGAGHSTVIDPMGISLATIGDEVGFAQARVSHNRIEQVRTINPALSMRRFTVSPKG